MQHSRSIVSILLTLVILLPSTMSSADIYVSSGGRVRTEAVLNTRIVLDDPRLSDTVMVISTPKKIDSVNIDLPCEHRDSVLGSTQVEDRNVFVIRSTILTPCYDPMIRVGADGRVFTDTTTQLRTMTQSSMIARLADFSDPALTEKMRESASKSEQLLASVAASDATIAKRLESVRDTYEGRYHALESDIARMILDERASLRYISPVAGYEVPEKDKLIPGTGRPYRKDTTDGVHHGWDIMAPYGTSVQALGKGVIIRIVSDWRWRDFDRLKRGRNLSEDDQLRNLDIFRGNQVWLKTLDGNVTFYSHLSSIDPNIRTGMVVSAGTRLGAIGKSGVPDRNYRDIHLHFEIQKNPYDETANTSDFLTIMQWPYIGMHEPRSEVKAQSRTIFSVGAFDSSHR